MGAEMLLRASLAAGRRGSAGIRPQIFEAECRTGKVGPTFRT